MRTSFLLGTITGGLAAALGIASLVAVGADEPASDVRLLVACDEAAKPKVLEALRPLPVVVHDLRTMERVRLESVAPFSDAVAVYRRVAAALRRVHESHPASEIGVTG